MPLNIDLLRRRLEARATELRSEIAAALHVSIDASPGFANHRAEVDDDAVADLETSLDIASVQRDQRELAEVCDALARIDSPAFGTCDTCREPIAWDRLVAQPQARRCIDCERGIEVRGFAEPRPSL